VTAMTAEQRCWTDRRVTGPPGLVSERITVADPAAGYEHLVDVHSQRNIDTRVSAPFAILAPPDT